MPNSLPAPIFDDANHHLRLSQGDCLDTLPPIPPPPSHLAHPHPHHFSLIPPPHHTPPPPPRKTKTTRHTFHYKLMKETNRGKQMKSVWEIRPPESWEKRFGKPPTQKPVALLERILLASTNEGDLVLDPFAGSGTTLLTAFRLRRHAVGCELNAEFLTLSIRRICSEMVQIDLSLTCI